MRNMDILRRCDVENPYKTCDGCKGGTECGEMANCRDPSLAWEDGYRAGLEAAAGKAMERALVCAQLADDIRAMKGGQG